MALQFSLHWIILFLNLWQKTKNNGLRQWNIKHYIFHFIMFTGTLTRILQHLSAQVSPVSPSRPPHVQWYWYCWILEHQSSADMQAMYGNVVQRETWRQLVLLSADKLQEQALLPSRGIAQYRQTQLAGLVPCCRVWWCSPSLRIRLVLHCLHVWATGPSTSSDFYNNKYKHKRGGVIVFTFIFMLKTSIYRGDARIYLCGVESK